MAKLPSVHNFKNLTGLVVGRLKVVQLASERASDGSLLWECSCSCGKTALIRSTSLSTQKTLSCGCLSRETSRRIRLTHGMKGTRVYRIWSGMMDRCKNPSNKDYSSYGGRGIYVILSWNKFENFYRDMGEPPDNCSLERRDNSLGYSASNCYWATSKQQARNRRSSKVVAIDGLSKTCAEWDELMGFYPGTVASRASRGWAESNLLNPINPKLSRCQKRS